MIGDSTVVLIDGAEYELRATELLDEGFVTGVPKNKDTARIFLTNYRIDQIQLDEA